MTEVARKPSDFIKIEMTNSGFTAGSTVSYNTSSTFSIALFAENLDLGVVLAVISIPRSLSGCVQV